MKVLVPVSIIIETTSEQGYTIDSLSRISITTTSVCKNKDSTGKDLEPEKSDFNQLSTRPLEMQPQFNESPLQYLEITAHKDPNF